MKNVERMSDCEHIETCVYKCKKHCKYYSKKKKFPPCPYVKESDNFSAAQVRRVRSLVASFGSVTSLMVLAAIALTVFTVLSSGLGLVLLGQEAAILWISLSLGLLIILLCGLAVWCYVKIQRTVKLFRKENAQSQSANVEQAKEESVSDNKQ